MEMHVYMPRRRAVVDVNEWWANKLGVQKALCLVMYSAYSSVWRAKRARTRCLFMNLMTAV